MARLLLARGLPVTPTNYYDKQFVAFLYSPEIKLTELKNNHVLL